MIKERQDVAINDRWNVEALYSDLNTWEKAFKESCDEKLPRWPELAAYKGRLGESPEVLKNALDLLFKIDRTLTCLYTYAHLRHDEDITNDAHKKAYIKITTVLHDFSREISWFVPELIDLSDKTIQEYLKTPLLSDYRFHIEKTVRMKKHTLSSDKEELMATAGQALEASQKAFSAINDADFKFEAIQDGQGNSREMSHALYGLYIRDQDRILRENAFKTYHLKYLGYENTLCELINGQVQMHFFNSRARKYSSSLEASLFSKNIDTSVYRALIQAVSENIQSLHRYIKLRKQLLGVADLHLYDMYVPLIKQVDFTISYQEAESMVIESVAPLGSEYQQILKQGLQTDRWVDPYENKYKRSGAYSSGCFGSMPYILMNYKNVIRDVFTLAHEAGHSMHSFLSRRHQPYHYSDYSIFVAEVASTFNEELLIQHMLKKTQNKEQRIFLINQKIEDIRTTLFRQTMFAEFELLIHDFVEQNIPLTPQLLKEEYRKLNIKYFGEEVVIDSEIDIEWARIPHFYYNFYVFQYATGISAALALADRVLQGGVKECSAYLSFLKGGCSSYPIDILQIAGVDMRTPDPVKAAIEKFNKLVNELEELINHPNKESLKKDSLCSYK